MLAGLLLQLAEESSPHDIEILLLEAVLLHISEEAHVEHLSIYMDVNVCRLVILLLEDDELADGVEESDDVIDMISK